MIHFVVIAPHFHAGAALCLLRLGHAVGQRGELGGGCLVPGKRHPAPPFKGLHAIHLQTALPERRKLPEVKHRLQVALVGGVSEPPLRFLQILLRALAGLVHHAQIILRRLMALQRGLTIQCCRIAFSFAGLDQPAQVILGVGEGCRGLGVTGHSRFLVTLLFLQYGEVVQRAKVPGGGGLFIQRPRLGRVTLGVAAFLGADGHEILGAGVILRRCLGSITECPFFIAGNAPQTNGIQRGHRILGFGIAALGLGFEGLIVILQIQWPTFIDRLAQALI